MANCKNLWVWLMTPGRASWTGLPMQCRRRYHVCASISPTKLAGTSALSSAAAIKHIWLTTSQYLCRACFEFKPCYDRTQYRMQIQIKPCVEDKSNHNKCNVIINANHNMIKKTKKTIILEVLWWFLELGMRRSNGGKTYGRWCWGRRARTCLWGVSEWALRWFGSTGWWDWCGGARFAPARSVSSTSAAMENSGRTLEATPLARHWAPGRITDRRCLLQFPFHYMKVHCIAQLVPLTHVSIQIQIPVNICRC